MKKLTTGAIALLFVAVNAHAVPTATFISQSVPNRLEAGKSYNVSLTFRNDGDAHDGPNDEVVWSAANGFALVAATDDDWYGSGWQQRGWVRFAPGEAIREGQTKTFNFTITAPANTSGDRKWQNFQWKVLKEGMYWIESPSTNVSVEIFNAPKLTTTQTPVSPPVAVNNADFSFNAMRGANVLQSAEGWIPPPSEMEKIALAAVNMKLNYIRIHVLIPEQSNAINDVIQSTKNILDIAYSYGLKTILTLNGYNGYTRACGWRRPFLSIKNNATTFVNNTSIKDHPGLFAWDLSNEPLWEASASHCLTADAGGTVNDKYQDVIDGVHAMYNVVRSASNKPTTVGDAQVPFTKYWNDISSFASPHFYVEMNAANPDWNRLQQILDRSVDDFRAEIQGKPMILGEFGFPTPKGTNAGSVKDETDRATAYQKFYEIVRAKNVGSLFWLMSTDVNQEEWSLVNYGSGSWKPAAMVVSTQWSQAHGATFVKQDVPSVMAKGRTYNIRIEMKNTGTSTWGLAIDKLGSLEPDSTSAWGIKRVLLNANPIEAVFSGQTKIFNFQVTAPTVAGKYAFQWRMLREGENWFGETTPKVEVIVQ